MRWRGRGRSWFGRWPFRWLYGYGRGLGYDYWGAGYYPSYPRAPWPRRWWMAPAYGYRAPYTWGYPRYAPRPYVG